MKRTTGIAHGWNSFAIAGVVACWFSAFTTSVQAQGSQGQDAVYNSSSGIVGSSAFIAANTFLNPATQGKDLCDTIFYIFTHNYPSVGAVIDARGISGATNLTCTHGTPWTEGSNTVSLPSTILLPATGAMAPNNPTPIIISSTWMLPPNTHLIGEGDGIPIYSSGILVSTPGTTIQAANGFSGSMIQFGQNIQQCQPPSEGFPCSGISVEHLTLDGQGQSINGIVNQFASEPSYVDHVSLYQIRGTGLLVSAGRVAHPFT